MDMECGRNVIDDPFVPKIVVENLHGLRDVVDTAIDDRRVERIPLLLRQRSLRRAVAPDDQLPGRTSRKYGSFVVVQERLERCFVADLPTVRAIKIAAARPFDPIDIEPAPRLGRKVAIERIGFAVAPPRDFGFEADRPVAARSVVTPDFERTPSGALIAECGSRDMGKGASAATALYAVFRPRGEGIVRTDTDGEHIVSVVGDQCTAGIVTVAGNVSHSIAALRPVGAACRFDVFLHGIDRFDVLLCQAVFVVVKRIQCP